MTPEIATRHTFALTLAAEAGALALEFFNKRAMLAVETKADPQDVVSRADREVENLIRQRLAAAFPDDAVLGEEGGATAGVSGFTWVVDPIDGTMPFLSGLPHWCVAIAITDPHATVAAVTHAPVMQETFDALLGGGCRMNGLILRVDAAQGLAGRMTALGGSHRTDPGHLGRALAGLMQAGGIFYRSGSGALMLADVAAGRLAGYYEPHMNAWDCLGGLLMITEAGGCIRHFELPAMVDHGGPVLGATVFAFGQLARVIEEASVPRHVPSDCIMSIEH